MGSRRKYHRWTNEMKIEILAYAEVHGVKATSAKYNVPYAYIYNWRKKNEPVEIKRVVPTNDDIARMMKRIPEIKQERLKLFEEEKRIRDALNKYMTNDEPGLMSGFA